MVRGRMKNTAVNRVAAGAGYEQQLSLQTALLVFFPTATWTGIVSTNFSMPSRSFGVPAGYRAQNDP